MFIISKLLKSINKKLKITIKLTIAKLFNNLTFLDSVLKQSRGIGYAASLDLEVKYLVGLHNEKFTLFDIGANIGNYSLMVKELFPKSVIYSFEPSKTTFDQLVQNTKSELSITPYQIGFGEDRKQANLYSNKVGSEMASIYHRQFENSEIKFNRTETINIDNFEWDDIGLIKLDVEGNELAVLLGARKTIESSNYPPIIFECNTQAGHTEHKTEIFNYLKSMGYRLGEIKPFNNMYFAQKN